MKLKRTIEKIRAVLLDMTDVAVSSHSSQSSACMVYNSTRDTHCPLCSTLVPRGQVHKCGVTNAQSRR